MSEDAESPYLRLIVRPERADDKLDFGPIVVARGTIGSPMDLPKTASVVVIGGGVVGCSIAYNLARRGLAGVVVVERETVGSGTTSKAAGGIRVQFPTETEIRFSLEAIRVFERFQDEFGVDPGYKKIGYLFLLSDPMQLRAFEKRIALQTKLGGDVRVITPDDARKLVPALRVDDLIAGVWGPGDGLAGPAEVTAGFARRARELGVKIAEGVLSHRGDRARRRRHIVGREILHSRNRIGNETITIHRDPVRGAQEPEVLRLERTRARRRHRDQLKGATHRFERIGFAVRTQLGRKAEEQLFRSTAAGNEAHSYFDEAHVQLSMRLNAVGVERELTSATQRQSERRENDRERRGPDAK